ncbi:MAG: 5'-nucleotidase, lipoprotein e(P4) family [Lysobacterales bacterium]
MNRFFVLPMFAAMLVGGCVATTVPHDAATLAHAAPATAAGPAANDNLNAVAWAQTAVEHDLVYRGVFRSAGEKLLKALRDRTWDALPRDERRNDARHLKPAVIVDIDETMLDNSPYQARLVAAGTSFDEFTWAQWCREKAASALPGALEFARLAAQHGVTVFYLSNRAQDLDEVTLQNLRADGFPIASGEPVFLGLGRVVDGCEQVGSAKGCRREWVGRRYRVLLQVGDQLGDFVDVPANTPQGRRAAIAPYRDWIGERWFVLPNPTYGAWEAALFNNDWSQPPARRREAKIGALRQ